MTFMLINYLNRLFQFTLKCFADTDYRREGQEHGHTRSSWHVSMSSPVEQQRQSVIQEILQTEAAYLRELLLVDEVS